MDWDQIMNLFIRGAGIALICTIVGLLVRLIRKKVHFKAKDAETTHTEKK